MDEHNNDFTVTGGCICGPLMCSGLGGPVAVEIPPVTHQPPTALPVTGPERRKVLREAADSILRSQWGGISRAEVKRDRYSRAVERRNVRSKKLGALERPVQAAEDQGVYVIGAPGHAVKIGIAGNVKTRLASIQTGCPERLRVYFFLEVPGGTARQIEKECHRRLSDHRKSGEWFDLDWRDAAAMVREVAGLVV